MPTFSLDDGFHDASRTVPGKRMTPPEVDRPLLAYETALGICLSAVDRCVPEETVDIAKSLGRVLRQDVTSGIAVPPFDKSAMDGYAVKQDDVKSASEKKPVVLKVVDEIPAGTVSDVVLRSGEAARIMTGAPLPVGADAVIRLEKTESAQAGLVQVYGKVDENNYVIYKGQDLLPGTRVASAGTIVEPALMGIMANCGVCDVKVSCPPSVGIISTGSELVPPGTRLQGGQIYDVNSYLLYGLCAMAGCDVSILGRVVDKSCDLLSLLNSHSDVDLLLLSGGMSVGDYDIVHETLKRAGVEEIFWRVRIKPGKPLFFGRRGSALVFGLPGNPVSSATNFYLFVLPVIDKLLGKSSWGLETGYAVLGNSMLFRPGRRKFLRAKLRRDGASHVAWILKEQRSGVLSPMVDADILVEVPEDARMVKDGDVVKVYYL